MKSSAILLAVAALLAPACAGADSGEEVFKARCSLCHEGGAGGAPRIGHREEWAPRAARGRIALYQTALKGKPGTAMMPKGGFRDLSEHEVLAAADYMLARTGLNPPLRVEIAPAATAPAAAAAPTPSPPAPAALVVAAAEFDDRTATTRIAEGLLALAPAGAKIDMQDDAATVSALGIRVATRQGVVWLRGTVRNTEVVESAETIAKSLGGGRKVENRLVAATLNDWD